MYQLVITANHLILLAKALGALIGAGFGSYYLFDWWEKRLEHKSNAANYERRSAEYQAYVKDLHNSHNTLVDNYEELRLAILDLKEENREIKEENKVLSKRNEFLTNELTIDRKRTRVMRMPTAGGTIQLTDEDLILDSPNYVSPNMEALAARGYQRINRNK